MWGTAVAFETGEHPQVRLHTSHGEWWVVGRDNPACKHRDGSMHLSGNLLVPLQGCQVLSYKTSLQAESIDNSLLEDWDAPLMAWDWAMCTCTTARAGKFFLTKLFALRNARFQGKKSTDEFMVGQQEWLQRRLVNTLTLWSSLHNNDVYVMI